MIEIPENGTGNRNDERLGYKNVDKGTDFRYFEMNWLRNEPQRIPPRATGHQV